MITNFEEITEDLTEREIFYLPQVKEILLGVLSDKPIKQKLLATAIDNNLLQMLGPGAIMMTPVRLRKYFNYFRTHGLLPIIGTSEGCYITADKLEIEKQIKSLQERANQINRAAEGMKKFIN